MDTSTIRSVVRDHRTLAAFTGATAVLTLVCLAGLALDPRQLGGQPIWAKPLKFSISLVLYSATLAWMISLVTAPRTRRWARGAGTVVAVAGTIEMVAIVGQVLRGRASHFNVATPLDTAAWAVMGTTIVVLWVATAAIGVLLLRERTLRADTAWAVRLGLGVTLLGMGTAFLMTGPTGAQIAAARATGTMPTVGAHAVGVPDGGPGLPLLGWSTTGGDLRIGHFVGLHALQGLPLLALALLLLAPRVPVLRDVRVRARLIGVAGAAWAGLTLLLVWQALRGQPIIAPDGVTLAAAAALLVATAGAALAVLRTGARRSQRPAPTVLEPR
ncbi:hypothetical protein [Actinomycetospora cinnamomea]|uniref:Uncharacterized protein n=1 Tax=Actinomycetospora cinnamomea TaxID=663609 RepID=A0A2U1FCT3_9PSEU|nr:hypothetical protein [Actinomycetospora cinnamomea]PVZ09997.1 hypothetical protein C8D89_10570 [Actinomycetospora cinnamomea]